MSAPPPRDGAPRAADPATRALFAPEDGAAEQEAALAWLRRNPDALLRFPDLIQTLTPPAARTGSGVADFQRYAIGRLQADLGEATRTWGTIVDTARANLATQSRIHRAVLALLDAPTLADLLQATAHDLPGLLDVDCAVLAVEGLAQGAHETAPTGVVVLPAGAVRTRLGDRAAQLSHDCEGDAALFGGGASLVRSQALVRLTISSRTPPGLLALGSRDPLHFQDGQGTELLLFLAAVLGRQLRAWLDLPE